MGARTGSIAVALASCIALLTGSVASAAPSPTPETPDATLARAIEAYCADRTEGPGPDIPQLIAAGLLPRDWDGAVDVVLDPPGGGGTACGTGAGTYTLWSPSRTAYPVSVTGCNGTVATFTQAPQKPLSVDQISYQLALELGLQEVVYGFWPTRTDDLAADLGPLKSANQASNPVPFFVDSDASQYKAPGMGDTVDHSEQILQFAPDFLFSGDWFGWPMAFGWDGPVPMEQNGGAIAPTYMGFTNNGWYCAATGDGAYDDAQGWTVASMDARPQTTFEYLYADLRNLGIIFDRQDRAFEVIRELKGQVADAMLKVGDTADGLGATTMLVGYGDSIPAQFEPDQALYYTQRDPLNAVMAQLGLRNVWADKDVTYVAAPATIESFVARMPDVIIMQSVLPDCQDVRAFIENDPTWAQAKVPAVVEDRLVCAQFKDSYLGLGLPDVLAAVADKIAAP